MKKFILLFLGVLLVGCATKSPSKINEDKTLFELGQKMYLKERYSEAIPYFEEIKNRFPDSPYSIQSELNLADAHFKTNEYESAQVEYESFRTLHPTHEKIPYVYLQIGRCQMYQAPRSVQKDQSETEMGQRTLDELVRRWPNSTEASEAKTYLSKAQEKLAKKQLYLAGFYTRQKKYFPAIKRLESLNNDETPPELRREALYKLGFVHMKMKNNDIAKMAFQRILEQNLDDSYQRKAKKYLAKLSKE
jgi:outer membrane protein assembly factor BamD